MGQGRTAYTSFKRIHAEMGSKPPPDWESLSHVGRMAWEAAAQAVALEVVPNILGGDFFSDVLEDDPEDPDFVECDSRSGFGDDIENRE